MGWVLLYLAVGLVLAVDVFVFGKEPPDLGDLGLFLSFVVFWPFLAAVLLCFALELAWGVLDRRLVQFIAWLRGFVK